MPRALKLVDPNAPVHSASIDDNWLWFWREYPRKKSKGDAYRAWQQTATIRPDIEAVISAIDRNLSTGHWRESEPQYIPLPATWLRAWGWEDE